MNDISPNFKGITEKEVKIIEKITKSNTPKKTVNHFIKHKEKLSNYAYWFILSTIWVSSNEGASLNRWRCLFESKRQDRLTSIMKPSETEAFNKLENEIFVYRAESPNEEDRIAYTLSLKTALMFANIKKTNSVSEFKVRKQDIHCIFLRRDEDEVIILNPKNAIKQREIKVIMENMTS